MTSAPNGSDGDFAKLCCGEGRLSPETAAAWPEAPGRAVPSRIAIDHETAADDLVRLVLALVETLRQLVERQAIRRVDNGQLSEDEVERLGLTLMRLEQRMTELKTHFGLEDDDLALRLGSLEEFVNAPADKNVPPL